MASRFTLEVWVAVADIRYHLTASAVLKYARAPDRVDVDEALSGADVDQLGFVGLITMHEHARFAM